MTAIMSERSREEDPCVHTSRSRQSLMTVPHARFCITEVRGFPSSAAPPVSWTQIGEKNSTATCKMVRFSSIAIVALSGSCLQLSSAFQVASPSTRVPSSASSSRRSAVAVESPSLDVLPKIPTPSGGDNNERDGAMMDLSGVVFSVSVGCGFGPTANDEVRIGDESTRIGIIFFDGLMLI